MVLTRLSFIFCILFMTSAFSKSTVQLLHTNDLHGFFDHSIKDPKLGGYAELKFMMDELKKQAATEGHYSLALDAGDFMEGSLYYLNKEGRRSMEMMNSMGYDAVVIGNHDWLMGSLSLNDILTDVPPRFAFLGANFSVTKSLLSGLSEKIKPFHIVEHEGFKIAILGLTTNERIYSWRVQAADIGKLAKSARKYVKKLRSEDGPYNVDYIVALTHIGFNADKELIENVSGIDLVVGGHSHQTFKEPRVAINPDKRLIPIVQAGEHGQWLGKMIFEMEKNQPLKILNYELLSVSSQGEKDPITDNLRKEAKRQLEEEYNYSSEPNQIWLNEVIARTETPLIHVPDNGDLSEPTLMTKIVADALRESVEADCSVHSPEFGGIDIPVGPITRSDLFNTHPRVFDFDDRYGWHVYTVKVRGLLLRAAIKLLAKHFSELGIYFSGITFDKILVREKTDKKPAKYKLRNFKVNGEKLRLFRSYTLAMPEGVIRAGLGITGLIRFVLRSISKDQSPIWFALMDKFQRMGVVTGKYQEEQQGFSSIPVNHSFIPPNVDLITD